MRKRSKHGFTIVELVVVIAVIGILTAILIPLFVNLTGKAQERDNQSFVRNINTQLAINEADKGFKNSVMEDSIKLAQNMGFDVTKITPYNNNDIVWDSVHDRFAILKSDYAQDKNQNKEHVVYADASFDVKTPLYQLWKVYAEYPDPDKTNQTQTYSIYAKEAAAWDNKDIANLHVGFDAGKNTKIKSVQYVGSENSQSQDEVVIRTNGGTLTVNAPLDTVKHYGDATVLNIEAVATSSYHEFGTVANAQIKTGRIVIENSEASIDNLLLIAKSDKSGFEKIVVETKTGAKLPTFDRTDVNVAENGTLVLNVVTPSTDEYIYLTKAGVIEQIVITNEVKDDVSSETPNVASKSATTQTVAEQVANVGKKNGAGNYVDSNGNVIALENLTSENIVIAEAKADETAVQTGLTKFSGGAGTEKSPFLIASEKDWETLATGSKTTVTPFGVTGYSYKVVNDLDMSYILKADRWKFRLKYFHGTIDFDNHQMTWMTPYDTNPSCLIESSYNGCTIKNANFNLSGCASIIYGYRHDLADAQNIVLQNINIYCNIVAGDTNNYALFYSDWMSEGSKLTMINCNNYCNITSSAENTGIFVGRIYGTSYPSNSWYYDIELINCNNYGTLINANGNAGMLFSNAGTNFDANSVTVENCGNYGTIIGKKNANLICGNLDEKYYVKTNANYDPNNNVEGLDVSNKRNGVCGKANIATLNVENGSFVLPQIDNAKSYLLSFVTSYNTGGGATTSIAYHLTEEQRAALDFKAYEFSVGVGSNSTTGATAITVGDGTLYVKDEKYIFINTITSKSEDLYITRQPTVSFMAFDENGNLLAAYNYTYSN